MKRLALLAIIVCAWFHIAPAHAQFNGCSSFCGTSSSAIADAPGFNNNQASGAAVVPLAFDGGSSNTVTGNSSAGNLVLPGLTTTLTNDLIVVALITNGSLTGPITPTSANLTFTRETGLTPPFTGVTRIDIYTAVAAATLSSEVITIHSDPAFTTGLAFALNGAKNSAPFDVNAAIPSTTSASGASATITTSASNTFAFGVTIGTVDNHGTGYAVLNATALTNSLAVYYKFASTTLSADVFQTATVSGSIGTAIVKGP